MAGSSFTGPLTNSYHPMGVRASRSDAPLSYGEPGYYVFFDDFDHDVSTVGTTATSPWTTVVDASGTTLQLTDAPYGVLMLSSGDTTENNGASIQTNDEMFDFSSGNTGWFETKVLLTDADQTDFWVGFTVNFATNPEAMFAAADHIAFAISDGDASIVCRTERSGTATTTDSGVDAADLTTATDPDDAGWVKLGILVGKTDDSGNGEVKFYIDDNLVATHTTNIPDDEYLAVGAAMLNGEAANNSVYIDYIYAAGTR